MLIRNYSKPFCIVGFILAEIYMLLVVLAPPNKHGGTPLPVPPLIESTLAPGAPVPLSYVVGRIAVCSFFFGPLGALVGLGVGLAFSGIVQVVRRPGPREVTASGSGEIPPSPPTPPKV